MNRDSNKYTIIFATIMVIVVALVLSLTHEALKGRQARNQDIDKMSQILRSINIQTTGSEAETEFEKLITDMYMIDEEGNQIPDSKDAAFDANLKAEMSKPYNERQYPVYVANVDGQTKYIMSLWGAGLWGPMWGYISVDGDGNTIFGADFDHDSETPGLGAEVSHSWFSDEFKGKHLFKEDNFKSIAVVKPGQTKSDQDYVDGISGGTITSHGVDQMLFNSLSGYKNFLIKIGSKE